MPSNSTIRHYIADRKASEGFNAHYGGRAEKSMAVNLLTKDIKTKNINFDKMKLNEYKPS